MVDAGSNLTGLPGCQWISADTKKDADASIP